MCWKLTGTPACANWQRCSEQTERQQEAEQRKLSALEQQAIRELVEDFPRVWKDARTSDRDRKRMVRWLLEDVTVLRQEEVITAHVRFKGGATQTITVPVGRGRCSSPELLALIDQLLSDFTDAEVAEQLNQRGWRTYEGKPFSAARVVSLRRYHQLKDAWHQATRAGDVQRRGSSVGLWGVPRNAHGLGTGRAASHVSDQ